MKKKAVNQVGFYSLLIFLCFIRAISSYVFIVPNKFAPGGVSGVVSIIYNSILPYNQYVANTFFNPAILILVLNLPLVILSFKYVNRKFCTNTLLCVLCYSAFMALFALVKFPVFLASDFESSVMILASLAGGITAGFCLGVMLKWNMSAGGTDVVAKIIYAKNPVINVQWLIFIFDGIVVLFSGVLGLIGLTGEEASSTVFVSVLTPIFYSFISMYVTSKVAEVIINGFESSVVFNVNTTKYNEIGEGIVNVIKRSATIVNGEGVYTHSERKILICVVRKKQLSTLKKLILSIDPDAFMFITNAREVNGFGFRNEN